MDENTIRLIEKEGAEALLDTGLSVPLKELHLPFCKKSIHLRVTMRRPTLAGQIRIAREWLAMGVTSEEMWHFSKEEEMRFLADHGKKISRMIAYTLCRGWISRHLFVGLTAWVVRNWMENKYLVSVIKKFVGLMGTDSFTDIIKSAEAVNEQKEERQSPSAYEGSHSPFGFVWQIASETGWSVDYILNGVNYQTLIMMLSDAPHYVSKKKNGKPKDERSAKEEADDIVGFFQSKLK